MPAASPGRSRRRSSVKTRTLLPSLATEEKTGNGVRVRPWIRKSVYYFEVSYQLRRREHDMNEGMNTRRSVMTSLAAAAAVLVPATAGAQGGGTAFRPTRHKQDSWMDELKGQHRVLIDAATAPGGAEAL